VNGGAGELTAQAVLAFVGGSLFWVQFRKLDREEDGLNMLPQGRLVVMGDGAEERGEVLQADALQAELRK
jgi:hypothetical protein